MPLSYLLLQETPNRVRLCSFKYYSHLYLVIISFESLFQKLFCKPAYCLSLSKEHGFLYCADCLFYVEIQLLRVAAFNVFFQTYCVTLERDYVYV